MKSESIDEILDWLARAALAGSDEATLAREFSLRCIEAGCPLSHGVVIIDTLHPQYEGRALVWSDHPTADFLEREFEPIRSVEDGVEQWRKSLFFEMLRDEKTYHRVRLSDADMPNYPRLDELRDAGHTDYVAVVHRLRDAELIEDADGFYAAWGTRQPEGFSDPDVQALHRLTTQLALALRLAAQNRLAKTLVETYLGRDPGRRVLEGGITRGKVEKINAVLWFSDISGYTRLSEATPSSELIDLLNDYSEAVITSVQEAGGDVLKLIGDGILAIFGGAKPEAACQAAITAGRALGERLRALSASRLAEGAPVAELHLGIHIGDVYYGNIGSHDRLDFTVIGPAVNEVSRIAGMCHSVDQRILCSSEFVALLPENLRKDFVSVGRFALRGMGQAQHLYTVDPGLTRDNGVQNSAEP